MSGSPDPAVPAPDAAVPPADDPPIRVNPPGRWVTTPDGERIYLLDPPRPAPAPAPVSVAPTPDPRPDPAPGAAASPEPRPARAAPPRPTADDAARDAGDGIQDIIAHGPTLVVRWGASVLGAVVLLLLVLASFVRYPEVVQAPASVTTPMPPVRVAAAGGGDLEELPVADGQKVAAGAVVAVLRSTARWHDVRWLAERLQGGSLAEAEARPLLLGDVQQPWSQYLDASAQYRTWAGDPYFQGRVEGLRRQAEDQRRLGEEVRGRVALLEREAALSDRDLERSRELARRQMLSPVEAERTEATALSRQQALASARGEVVSQRLRIAEIEGQILVLEQGRRSDEARLTQEVQRARAALAEAIRQWEARYLLRAPIAGRVAFFRTLSPGQYVNGGEPILAVVPESGPPLGTIVVSGAGAGRVHAGQKVLVTFDGFPVTEFGKVEARVRRLSLVPSQPAPGSESGAPRYLVTVTFPRGLRTSTGHTLALRQEMSGSAEIVTDDLSVLQRLLVGVRGLASAPADEAGR